MTESPFDWVESTAQQAAAMDRAHSRIYAVLAVAGSGNNRLA